MTISWETLVRMWPVILVGRGHDHQQNSGRLWAFPLQGITGKQRFWLVHIWDNSEFGFIIAAVGVSSGVLTASYANLIVSLVFVTILSMHRF
jgi:hypothetical protein